MLRTPATRKLSSALRCRQPCQLQSCHHFSSTTPIAAISPHRRIGQNPSATPESPRRGQSTAAAPAPYATTMQEFNCQSLTSYSAKLGQSQAQRSMQSPHGKKYTHYKKHTHQKWTNRECTCCLVFGRIIDQYCHTV